MPAEIQTAELRERVRVAFIASFLEPGHCRLNIFLSSASVEQSKPEHVLGLGKPLLRGATVPVQGFLKMTGDCRVASHQFAQEKLSGGNACCGSAFEKFKTLGRIPRDALSATKQRAEIIFSAVVILLHRKL